MRGRDIAQYVSLSASISLNVVLAYLLWGDIAIISFLWAAIAFAAGLFIFYCVSLER